MAIAKENDALEPGSEAFLTLNPGLIHCYSRDRLAARNQDGVRVFETYGGGHKALLANLEQKCRGNTRAKDKERNSLSLTSPLSSLVQTFKYIQPRKIVEYLQDALEDRAITEMTPLQYFLSDIPTKG